MTTCTLRLNMTGCSDDPELEAARYQAALDMAAYADASGFSNINVEEHHCSNTGWMPAPLVMAGMLVARTQQAQIGVMALLATLYDPVRLAEEVAILDLASRGRFHFIAGLGYREIEYHAMDKDWQNRGANLDFLIETLRQAWSGEPFEYRGQTIRVTPRPYTRPHPLFYIGGFTRMAARRAARYGLPFYPPAPAPELEAFYHEECARHGHQGVVKTPGEGWSVLFIDEDPEAAWPEIGPHFLAEVQEYSSWTTPGYTRPLEAKVGSIEQLRAEGRYEIITPDECLARIRDSGGGYAPLLHPLVGGVPVDRAWASLRLFVERVLGRC